MIPFPIDVLGFVGIYAVLMLLYHAILSSDTHSIGIRILSSLLSYVISFFFLNMVFHFLRLLYLLFNDATAILGFFFLMVAALLTYRIYNINPEKYMIHEMLNFVRTSLTFGNYFRLRDVDTQEQIGTHKMKKIYEEVHGKPFTEEVIATPFDRQVTTFKKVTLEELQEKKRKYPPEYFEEVAQLKSKRTTDVSVSFRFQLLDNRSHSFLSLMDHFQIDPVSRILSISVIFPVDKTIPFRTRPDQVRLTVRVYESLQILISQEWLDLYVPFFNLISVSCLQKEFSDTMSETVHPLMTFTISHHNLLIRASRITTETELSKIAEIRYL